MDRQRDGVRLFTDLLAVPGRHNAAARKVVRILQTDQSRFCDVIRLVDMQGRLNFWPLQMTGTINASDRSDRYARKNCCTGKLKVQNMAAVFDHDLLPGTRMHLYGKLISHRAARNEQRSFFFKYLRRTLLEPAYRWVFAKDIVANFG